MSLRAALPLLVLVPAVPAVAEEPAPIESVAEVKAGERAELDHRTIQRYGDILGRFDIVVAAAEPDARRADGAMSRRVRYMVNCEDGTTTLAAVGVFDANGNLLKAMVAPPRSLDPVKPEKGSQQAKWLRRVCMF